VIRKNRETGETVGFLMTLIPNLSYIESTHFDPFKKNSYTERDKKLNGYVLYHDMDGNFVNGWMYDNGHIYAINPTEEGNTEFQLRSGCNWYTIEYSTWDCHPTAEWESGVLTGIGVVCQKNHIEMTWSSCSMEDSSGAPPAGDIILPGGVNNLPTPSSVAPQAKRIFRNSNMAIDRWNSLENMINKIISDCLGMSMYNALASALNGKTLIIEFVNGNPSGFTYTSSSISLDMSGESNRLFHEMWHAYQSYQETASSYPSSTLNHEFESWYAQYLYISRLPEYKIGSKWYDWYYHSKIGLAVQKFKTFIDAKGNLLQGESAFKDYLDKLSLPGSDFRNGGYQSTLLYQYDGNRTAAYDFKNLTNLSKNCQ